MKTVLTKMKNNKTGGFFGLSLFFVGIIFFLIKIVVVFFTYKYLYPLQTCIGYFVGDLLFFIIVLLLLTIAFGVKNRLIRGFSNVLICFFVIFYCIDIFTINYFITRETILSVWIIVKYGGNGGRGFMSIILFRVFMFLLVWLIIYVLLQCKFKYDKIVRYFTLKNWLLSFLFWMIIKYFCIPLLGICFYIFVPDVDDILSLNVKSIKTSYQERILFAGDYDDYIKYEKGDEIPLNIILIFGESLSSIDSKLLGGNDNMPNFDKIQVDGLRFTNFIANGTDSITSHQSVFLGIPPINRVGYYEYAAEGLPSFLNKNGYETIFVSTANLKFLDERDYLKKIGFRKIIGEEAFEEKKKYTFDAAPDGDLYDKVIEEVKIQTGKYFIALPTISFHTEYNCPYGNTQRDCIRYTDEKLYDFYISLKDLGFFNSGILIIVGDHRKREPIEKGEYDLFGLSWENRVLATIVGSGIVNNTVNSSLITHTDLYYSLKKLLGHGSVKVDMYYNNIFTGELGRNRGILEDKFIFKEGESWVVYDIKSLKERYEFVYLYYVALKKLQLFKSLSKKSLK